MRSDELHRVHRPGRPQSPAVPRSRLLLPCWGLLGFALVSLASGCVNAGPPKRVSRTSLDGAVLGDASPGVRSAGAVAWRLGGRAGASDAAWDEALQDPQGQPAQGDGDESVEQRNARLRLQFGSNVVISAAGDVTKQYFLAGDLATTFLKLITPITAESPPSGRAAPPVPAPGTNIGGPEAASILGRMLREHTVEITFVPDFEVLSGVAILDSKTPAVTGAPPTMDSSKAPTVALALVTAQPSALTAFEAALDLFYSSIPQIEISVLVVEYNVADALSFGVATVDANTPILGNLTSSQLVRSYTSSFAASQPIVGVTPVADIGRFALGGIHDSWELNAVIEALEANNLADISSSPKLVVRNGGVAAIQTLTDVPFPKAKFSQLGAEVATDISFRPVGVRMNIVPMIAGTDSVILQVFADVSAVTGFADTEPIVTPITSERSAVTTVYLRLGSF